MQLRTNHFMAFYKVTVLSSPLGWFTLRFLSASSWVLFRSCVIFGFNICFQITSGFGDTVDYCLSFDRRSMVILFRDCFVIVCRSTVDKAVSSRSLI